MTRKEFIAELLQCGGTDDTEVVIAELDGYAAKQEKYERYDDDPEPHLRDDGKIQIN